MACFVFVLRVGCTISGRVAVADGGKRRYSRCPEICQCCVVISSVHRRAAVFARRAKLCQWLSRSGWLAWSVGMPELFAINVTSMWIITIEIIDRYSTPCRYRQSETSYLTSLFLSRSFSVVATNVTSAHNFCLTAAIVLRPFNGVSQYQTKLSSTHTYHQPSFIYYPYPFSLSFSFFIFILFLLSRPVNSTVRTTLLVLLRCPVLDLVLITTCILNLVWTVKQEWED